MKHELAHDILCPNCYREVAVDTQEERCGHIYSGAIRCLGCGREYPVFAGIAVLPVIDSTWEPMLREVISRIDIAKTVVSGGFEKDRDMKAEEAREETSELMENLVDEALKQVDVKEGTRILDVGAGLCSNATQFADLGADVVAQDVDMYHLQFVNFWEDDAVRVEGYPLAVKNPDISRNYFSRVLADIHRIPFRDSTFDVTFCRSTIHHLERRSSAIREMARVTRNGGQVLLISEPTRSIIDEEAKYLEGNFDFDEGLNEQVLKITDYTIPLLRYCDNITVRYFRPAYMDRTKKFFELLRINGEKHFHSGETLDFKRSFKLLFAGTGVNISATRKSKKVKKPRRLDEKMIVGDARDLIFGSVQAEENGAAGRVGGASTGHPYSVYSPLSVISPQHRDRLKRMHMQCLDPGEYPCSVDLHTSGRKVIKGWRAPESGPGCTYRFSNKIATCCIRNMSDRKNISMKMLGFTLGAGDATGTILINGNEAYRYCVPEDRWTEIRFEGPPVETEVIEIQIINDFLFVPDEVSGNGDMRELGVGVERIWQS